MFLGVLLPTAATVFIIYCIVFSIQHSLAPCWCPKAMAHFVIVIVGLRSTVSSVLLDTTRLVFHLGVTLSSSSPWNASTSRAGIFINIINNNARTSGIKTIANTISFPSLHCPNIHVVEGLSWWMGMAFDKMLLLLRASIAGVVVNGTGPTWPCCLLTWSMFPSWDWNYQSTSHCCAVAYVSQFPLPLSDRVPIVVAAMVSKCWREVHHGDKDVDRGHVDIIDVDNGLLRSESNKQTNTR